MGCCQTVDQHHLRSSDVALLTQNAKFHLPSVVVDRCCDESCPLRASPAGAPDCGTCSGLGSRATTGSIDSQICFSAPDQTMLIFDWDDTLFPTSWLLERENMEALDTFDKYELLRYVAQFQAVVSIAKSVGEVVIVTNSRPPWVDTSMDLFMKDTDTIADVPVFYAMDLAGGSPDLCPTQTKVQAMEAAVNAFYSRYPGQSWKNIVSVGDAVFEQDAIREVCTGRPIHTLDRTCRTKIVKFVEQPSLGCLVEQLTLLASWLLRVVQADGDVNIDMNAGGRRLQEWADEYG
uniref:Uncharacterized protein n=1 Tax=Noctiluca scintillans TaxID=2966 RepID=A0A7S1A1R0_NOCSC|mmetsp:Transcript_27505/g.72465  ORF Transcript_27505/g.72465 Transcript_27505/m.72465 type:complete len:291 (+) Transcript_27505:77-949(+)|eukprot:CAMPEP_0194525774 /NCGR_PEP_ID=MMETSP0253-20130528/61365_1 /TAXON_ID=2966 /ORGANISM="Noctiluca scintillans" /LENGTH=290 /DNA_ID=CAMNT_0039370541 /DNA_START=29 /DNA_END=901 /DNA_ORIENTATION=-